LLHWRGPNYNGSFKAKNLPQSWSVTEKKENVAWSKKLKDPAHSSPIIIGDKIFFTESKGKNMDLTAICVSRKNGKTIWQKKLKSKGKYFSSLTIADGKSYCMSLKGEISVFSADRNGKLLSSFSTGKERCTATITVSHDGLFVRTAKKLICVKK